MTLGHASAIHNIREFQKAGQGTYLPRDPGDEASWPMHALILHALVH